jgi:hypothetical protein
MARKSADSLQKHTLNLRAGDLDRLQELFPRQQATVLVRQIVSKFVDNQLKASDKIRRESVEKLAETLESPND